MLSSYCWMLETCSLRLLLRHLLSFLIKEISVFRMCSGDQFLPDLSKVCFLLTFLFDLFRVEIVLEDRSRWFREFLLRMFLLRVFEKLLGSWKYKDNKSVFLRTLWDYHSPLFAPFIMRLAINKIQAINNDFRSSVALNFLLNWSITLKTCQGQTFPDAIYSLKWLIITVLVVCGSLRAANG